MWNPEIGTILLGGISMYTFLHQLSVKENFYSCTFFALVSYTGQSKITAVFYIQ